VRVEEAILTVVANVREAATDRAASLLCEQDARIVRLDALQAVVKLAVVEAGTALEACARGRSTEAGAMDRNMSHGLSVDGLGEE